MFLGMLWYPNNQMSKNKVRSKNKEHDSDISNKCPLPNIQCDLYRENVFCFEILVPPRVTKSPNNTTINEGENVTLTCDAEGPPKPTFTWSNAGEKVTIEKIISKNNKLELRNVRSAGRYHFTVTCIASNKGGATTANATIEILGRFLIFTQRTFKCSDAFGCV